MNKTRKRESAEEHTFLAIRVESYEADAGAGLNLNLVTTHPYNDSPEDFVFAFGTKLEIKGVACYPTERSGEKYEVTFRAKDSGQYRLRLKDIQARDEHLIPLYRQYRGGSFAVYEPPAGLSTIERRRHDRVWQGCLFVESHFTRDMLILLGHNRPLYLSVHELKVERQRWIRSISLQSTNPRRASAELFCRGTR
jgi:hypothetical protein